MTQRRFIVAVILAALLVAVAAVLSISRQPRQSVDSAAATTAVPLDVPFASSGFSLDYPADWQHNIPQANLFFLASPEVLRQQPGASMVIQRSTRLMVEAEALEDALEIYLERGPLRSGSAWMVTEAISATTVAGRDAVVVVLEGADGADAVPMHAEILVTHADNRLIYVFAMSAPLDQWDAQQPTFAAILASVSILE